MQSIISISSLLLLAISVQSKTYASVKSYYSLSCSAPVVDSTYYETGVCYTYKQLCDEGKFSSEYCKIILNSTRVDQISFIFTCSGKTIKREQFSDSKCTQFSNVSALPGADTCNIHRFSCTEIRPAIIFNGTVQTPAETPNINAGESHNIIFGVISIMGLAFLF